MENKTQQSLKVVKQGIDLGIKAGVFSGMDEVFILIEAYNQLVGELESKAEKQESENGKETKSGNGIN